MIRRLLDRFRRKKRPDRAEKSEPNNRRKWIWGGGSLLLIGLLALFFWFTSARMLEEPMELGYGASDLNFSNSLGPLLSAEFTGGNQVEFMVNGDEFFPAMLEDIAKAEKSITFESYIWSSGIVSNQFIDALTERVLAGVKVHVLVDGMGVKKFADADQKRLIDAGVEFLFYGREHWYEIKPNINHRTHRKLLIIDGRVGYTGGMCVDDLWLGNATLKDHWRETQIRLEGPVVRQMQAVFATNWLQTTARLLVGTDYFPEIPSLLPEGSTAHCYKSGPNEDPENARVSYLMAIAAARKSIRISHAYFVPDELAQEMLVAARERGVTIQVIVPAHNDSSFGRAAARSRWGKLLEAGVEFYQYEPAMYHCKMMVVDDVFLTIGSVNFDNRSFSINDEVNVNVLDRGVARAGHEIFNADLKDSERLTLEQFQSRAWWQKVIDRACGLFRSQL